MSYVSPPQAADDPADAPAAVSAPLGALLDLLGLEWCDEHGQLEQAHEPATLATGHGSNMGFPQLPPVVGPGNP